MESSFDPFDLTILYTEDTIQWCEYLFDIFKDFEIQQNSEDITEFPTNHRTLQSIQDSLVTVVIISPLFLQKCNPRMQEHIHQAVGLICGIDDADMEELYQKMPSSRDWYQVEAVAGSAEISKVVLKVLHDANDVKERHRQGEIEDTYIEVNDGVEGFIQSDYMVMENLGGKPKVIGGPENTYFVPDQPDMPEETYESMMAIQAPVGSGHVFQPSSQGYVDMKEAKHLSQCSAGLTIHPERARSGEEGSLYILLNDPLANDQYTVSFQGQLKKSEVIAKQKNTYTLQVDLPKDHPAELTDVQVTRTNRAVVGTFKFIFTSIMDELAQTLQGIVDPMRFMCQALGISTADANELDNKLYEHIQTCLPSGGLNLLVGQSGAEQKVITEVPTALHFAAKYGLKNICSMLITCPGAVQAMKLKNRDGLTPDIMAGMSGHSDLKSFLENFVEVAEDESIPGVGGNPSSYMFMKTGLIYLNQTAVQSQLSKEQASDYDSPFIVPIPAKGVPFTREETIKKLVQGEQEDIEEYYGSLAIDMSSFERDQDGEEDYEKVEDESGLRKRSTKRSHLKQRAPWQQTEEKPSATEMVLPPPVEPRLAPPPSEQEGEAPEKPPPRKNVKAEDILGLQPLATGQQHLIEIQNRVKNSEVTVDEAVMLFKNWELLQEKDRLSFSAQVETLKVLKQHKQKAKQTGGPRGFFTKKKKGGPVGEHIGQSIFYSPGSPVVKVAGLVATCSQALAPQPAPPVSLKFQERMIQSEISVQNRPTSTTSLDSHGSRDSSYNSAPDEPDQEKYHSSPASTTPASRRQTQQDRNKRISAAYDQLSNVPEKSMPPVPSRSTAPKPGVPPCTLPMIPKPSPPYGHYQPSPSPSPGEEDQPDYMEFDEEPIPGDLPGLPPPPPPTEMGAERALDVKTPVSPTQSSRYSESPLSASKYPQVTPRQPAQKRPIPKPRLAPR
ncbi:B-cell scaffold protein with ankyrin repeats-like isoform X2 [Patiria miniata]|uniref:DBB domain-containing protein n=1 Tax=Patiria miniata TaxID=46514 RepID=A0A914A8B0_PATMI|nr:B-cell scaffold protein with ankyrin repeats-like isoform X2 [Patiria miniata]